MNKVTFDTYKKPNKNLLEMERFTVFNFKKYRITIEEIEESLEETIKRIDLLWDFCHNEKEANQIRLLAQQHNHKLKSLAGYERNVSGIRIQITSANKMDWYAHLIGITMTIKGRNKNGYEIDAFRHTQRYVKPIHCKIIQN